jgi:hypothetical protein
MRLIKQFGITARVDKKGHEVSFTTNNGAVKCNYRICFGLTNDDGLLWEIKADKVNANVDDAFIVIGSADGWRRLIMSIVIGEYVEDIEMARKDMYELIEAVSDYVNSWIHTNSLKHDVQNKTPGSVRVDQDYFVKRKTAIRKEMGNDTTSKV